MNGFPESWLAMTLSDAVINIAITDKKIPQKEYLREGAIPIIDQGQNYIGGYTDEKEKVVDCELPTIVFGDHTRAVKFVNRPFAPGADGVKIMQPQRFFNPRLLEYFIRHIAAHLTDHGYARHYQHLVKSTIPLPPTNEQHRIVAKIEELFSELDKGVEYLKTAQAQLKVYRQALLKHAFEGKLTVQWREQRRAKQSVAPAKAGAQPLNDMDSRPTPSRGLALRGNDEVSGGNDKPLETAADLLKRIQQERVQRYQQQLADWEASGKQGSKPKPPKSLPSLTAEELVELSELPEGWGWVKFGELTQGSQNGISKRKAETGKEFIVLRLADIVDQRPSLDSPRTIRLTEEEIQNYVLHKDELLCIRVNGSPDLVGRMVLISANIEAAFCDHFIRFKLLTGICSAGFLRHFFDTHSIRRYVELNKISSAGQNTVNQEMLSSAFVAICGIEEQKVIVQLLEEKFSEADQLDQTITTALQQAEALRQSILKKAFSGQLVPQDPNDEPASELLARIKAERVVNKAIIKP